MSKGQLTGMPHGRPTDYSKELSDTICEKLALGQSMAKISKQEGMPAITTLFRWLREKDDFRQSYEKAKDECTDYLAEQLLDIADDGTNDYMAEKEAESGGKLKLHAENIQRSRLRVDARKWYLSKIKPTKYGDRLIQEVTGANGKDLIPDFDINKAARQVAFLLSKKGG